MKKTALLTFMMTVSMAGFACAGFWDSGKPATKAAAPAAQAPAPAATPAAAQASAPAAQSAAKTAAAPAQDPAAEAKAKETLSMQSWTIYSSPSGQKGAQPVADVVAFTKEGKFTSQNLSAKEYPSSNISITLQGTTIIWETMQTAKKGDMASWRGELQNGVMHGVLSLQPVKGMAQDFYFSTVVPGSQTAGTPGLTNAGSGLSSGK